MPAHPTARSSRSDRCPTRCPAKPPDPPGSAARRELFAYWRVAADAQQPAVGALRALHRRWQDSLPSVRARLYRRAPADGAPTLMEHYAVSDGGWTDALRQQVLAESDAAGARWRLGERHLEWFDSVD